MSDTKKIVYNGESIKIFMNESGNYSMTSNGHNIPLDSCNSIDIKFNVGELPMVTVHYIGEKRTVIVKYTGDWQPVK